MKYASLNNLALLCALCLLWTNTSRGVDIYVRAEKTSLTLPDGKTVEMWGLIRDTDDNFATLETTAGYGFQGRSIEIPPTGAGNTLVIRLFNRLDVPTSVVIPGQNGYAAAAPHATFVDDLGRTRARSFVAETAPGAVGVYQWNNVAAGTYLLYSGSHAALQVQMGLYSPLTRQQSNSSPYPGVQIPASRQATLLFSEIAPDVHDAVQEGNYGPTPVDPTRQMTSTMHSRPRYFLINGVAYSQAAPPPDIVLGGNRNTPLMLRLLNAGLDAHVPVVGGLPVSAIAEDGAVYRYPREQSAVFLPALKTADVVLTAPAGARLPVYDRRLGLVNGTQSPGGMLVYVRN